MIASNAKYILVLNEINMEISALNQKLFMWSKNGGNLTAISFRSQKDNKPETRNDNIRSLYALDMKKWHL